MSKRILLFIFLISFFAANAQDAESEKDHHHHHNEIGIASSPVYSVKEESLAFGLHLHYLHTISHSKFSAGVGIERIFDEHGHITFGIIAGYRPGDRLLFSVSPGLTLESESDTPEFAAHFEAAYEFEIKNVHIGPVFEFAVDKENYHLSLGLHLGLGF